MYTYQGSPTLANLTFIGNRSIYSGGAQCFGESRSTVTNVRYFANYAAQHGGAVVNGYADVNFFNVLFVGNIAGDSGGVMRNDFCNPWLLNTVFYGNQALGLGGGGAIYIYGATTGVNSIFWNNSPTLFGGTLGFNITYSDIQEGGAGAGTIVADPLFVDPDGADNVLGTLDDDFHLQANSPVIDAGQSSATHPETDLGDNTRIRSCDIDMGPYESQVERPCPSIGKQVDSAFVASPATPITYTLILSNTGLVNESLISLTDTLPRQVNFAGWIHQPANAQINNDQLTWNGSLASGSVLTFTFEVVYVGPSNQSVFNTAQFAGTYRAGSASASFSVARFNFARLPLIIGHDN